jgi:anti-sigma28 factor (negative regulator of flagellin synthesis)
MEREALAIQAEFFANPLSFLSCQAELLNVCGRLLMRHAQERPMRVGDKSAEISQSAVGSNDSDPESSLTPLEMAQLREEKLEAIRMAIARGAYDSDELFDKALERMLHRLEEPEGESDLPVVSPK